MGWFRRTLFHSIRILGGFAIAQYLTRAQLRILCYHGFSISDEHELAPYVFMRLPTFERRMSILRKRGLPVISIDDAVERLRDGKVANCETVITLDDGWASNLMIVPILQSHAYPACIYITTEHLNAGTQAFRVTVIQMMQRSHKDTVSLRNIHPKIDGDYQIGNDPEAAGVKLVTAAEAIGSLRERQQLLAPLAEALGLNYSEFTKGGRFQFLSEAQIRELARLGISIQLHSHTHTLPDDSFEAMAHEIQLNRRAITQLTGIEPIHFCYPSGKYSPRHPEWLARLGIASATTCDSGFNDSSVSPLLLRRYLDSDTTSDIEFEAEIAGVRELLRRLRSGLRTLRSTSRGSAQH
jgi:peptidoglycan/xylan/chitin deacetylase (PgdA/CDA1 family)